MKRKRFDKSGEKESVSLIQALPSRYDSRKGGNGNQDSQNGQVKNSTPKTRWDKSKSRSAVLRAEEQEISRYERI